MNAFSQMVQGVVDGVLGLSHGQVQVRLNNHAFVGGDVVSGVVHLQCFIPFAARGVILTLHGYEYCTWQEEIRLRQEEGETGPPRTEVRQYDDRREFFRQQMPVHQISGMLQPGQYQFPFEYQLPAVLPGTFAQEGGNLRRNDYWRAEVLYMVEAGIDVAFKSNISHALRLVVNEKFDRTAKLAYTENGKSFLGRGGRLDTKLWLDSNCYFPGNTITARLEANNTSTKRTDHINVKVVKTITMSTRNKSTTRTFTIYTHRYPGFDPCFFGVRFLPYQLPLDTLPSTTSGKLVRCTYSFILECSIPGAINLTLRQPVRVLAPQFLYADNAPTDVPPPQQVPGDVSYRPPWQPDSAAPQCNACKVGFTVFKRRHHCRHCSKVFCANCSKRTTPIPNLGYVEAVRVCDGCYDDAAAGGKHFQELPTDLPEAKVVEVAWTPPAASAPPDDSGAQVQAAVPQTASPASSTATATTTTTNVSVDMNSMNASGADAMNSMNTMNGSANAMNGAMQVSMSAGGANTSMSMNATPSASVTMNVSGASADASSNSNAGFESKQSECPHMPTCTPDNNGPCWQAFTAVAGAGVNMMANTMAMGMQM